MVKQPTLTLRDVAELAHVSRAVVSTWRRRPQARGRIIPFPQPVATVDGVEQFGRDEVVVWLDETGRGNNPDAGLDALAATPPASVDVEDVITLLCLYSRSGEEPGSLDGRSLTDLAEKVDPEDELLLREVRRLGSHLELQRYVDDLIEASYGPPDALQRLLTGRLTRSASDRGLSRELIDLVAVVAAAARDHLADPVALVPPADHHLTGRLLAEFPMVRIDHEGARQRAQRRRVVINGQAVVDDGATVRVLSLVGAADDQLLDAVDRFVLALGPTDIGIVIGAAAALCDPLADEAEYLRSQTLRPGNLAMAVRLPRGLWKAAHRQSLGLWLLQGGRTEQHLWVADLAADTIMIDELATDAAAALQDAAGRSFRYARRIDLAPVLTGGRPVVPRGIRAIRIHTAGPESHLNQIYASTLVTSEPIAGYDVTVAPAPGQIVLRQRSLGELKLAGHVTMKRGSRIDPSAADPTGTVRVLSADGSTDELRLDPLDAESRYPRATRTEPGDVIFEQGARPRARVDNAGGALVAAPSRILRLASTATIGPHALAALINETAPEHSEWETWNVPDLPVRDAQALDAAIASAHAHLALLQRHIGALKDLSTNLIRGVAAGAITIDPDNEQEAG